MMDPILFWNDVALEANRVSHTDGKDVGTLGPTLSSRALAIVHLAMYDAFAGASGNSPDLPPYLTPGPVPGVSVDAAVAAAAHATLSSLFPSQRSFFDSKLAEAGVTSNPGHAFGLKVAQNILADRAGDPHAGASGYEPSPARGRHRPDPDNPDQGFHAPFYGARSKGFAITARHELDKPPKPVPQLGTPDYIQALREVRGRGIAPELMGTVPAASGRTVDQTVIGIYWGYDGAAGLGTPPRLYNQIVREVACNTPHPKTGKPNTPAQNARLFALVNVAMADAGILAWDQKYIHDFWRPVLGIREHDTSMGPTGMGNNDIDNDTHTLWLPLGAPKTNSNSMEKNFTPNFPAYPSGHATFGAAAFHITRLFYGVPSGNAPDKLFKDLTFVSDEFNGINKDNKGAVRPRHVRNFPNGLWQMIEENGRSRVYLGVHWLFDAFAVDDDGKPNLAKNVGGVPLGLKIAEDIFTTGMKKSTVGPRS